MERLVAGSAEELIDRYFAALVRGDSKWTWLVVAILLAVAPSYLALAESFSSNLVVQDDARQFIFWMAKWRDPTLFRGDLLADYWESVSPWLYVAFYRVFDLLGIPPLIASKLMPPVLIVATVFFAYRVAFALGNHAPVAFLCAILVLLLIVRHNSVFSATPRGFALPAFLAVLDGLVRGRMAYATIAQFMLCGIYPQLALVSLGAAGFTVLRWSPAPRFDFSRRSLGMIGLMAAATLGALLPLLLDAGKYGPIVNLDQARSMPVFRSGGGTSLFTAQDGVDRLCDKRLGVSLKPILYRCHGYTDPRLLLNILILSVPPILVFWGRLQQSGTDPRPTVGAEIYLYVFIVAFISFVVAHVVLFKLHLPSRYIARPMTLILPLAVGHFAGLWALWLLKRPVFGVGMCSAAAKALLLGLLMLGLLLAFLGALKVRPGNRQPNDPEFISTIAALAPDKIVAGFVSDMNFVPVLAKRTVLFNEVLAVPYHLGYYRSVETRMRDMVTVEFSTDPSVVASLMEKWSVDIYVVSKARLTNPDQKSGFAGFGFVPDAFERGRETRRSIPTILSDLAPVCTLRELTDVIVLDAVCIIRGARSKSSESRTPELPPP